MFLKCLKNRIGFTEGEKYKIYRKFPDNSYQVKNDEDYYDIIQEDDQNFTIAEK